MDGRTTGYDDGGAMKKTWRALSASWPALCRASTRRRYASPAALAQRPGVDGRDKPGHDAETLGKRRGANVDAPTAAAYVSTL